jgi:hypothetical protein
MWRKDRNFSGELRLAVLTPDESFWFRAIKEWVVSSEWQI